MAKKASSRPGGKGPGLKKGRAGGSGSSPATLVVAGVAVVALAISVMSGGIGDLSRYAPSVLLGFRPRPTQQGKPGIARGSVELIAPRLPALAEPRRWTVPCSNQYAEDSGGHRLGCHPDPDRGCKRVVADNFVSAAEVVQLRDIAARGMAGRPSVGGPTIMDINTGYVRDDKGMANLFDAAQAPRFKKEDFALYKDVIERIRQRVMAEFGASELFFTAPTFMTRLVGNDSWAPSGIHDEYVEEKTSRERKREREREKATCSWMSTGTCTVVHGVLVCVVACVLVAVEASCSGEVH